MKLSIITINYNNRSGLERTMESILAQTFRDFEWVVIDGGSDDGSYELLTQNSRYIDYWVSEKDSGIYNAINKGVSYAKGDYVNFMNSGDCFADKDVLGDLIKMKFDDDIIYGDVLLQKEGEIVGLRKYKQLSFQFIYESCICHQASFIKRQLLLDTPYNETFKIVSDYEFWLKMIFKGKSFMHIDRFVCLFDIEGISSTNRELLWEERRLAKDNTIPACLQHDYSISCVRRLIPLWDRHKLLRKGVTAFILLMEFLDKRMDR